METHLTDQEKEHIVAFCANETMFEAVRKVILQGLYIHGVNVAGQKSNPLQNGAFSLVSLSLQNPIPNEEIGAQLRAQWAGLNALENAYKDLKNIKSTKAEEIASPYNEAV